MCSQYSISCFVWLHLFILDTQENLRRKRRKCEVAGKNNRVKVVVIDALTVRQARKCPKGFYVYNPPSDLLSSRKEK